MAAERKKVERKSKAKVPQVQFEPVSLVHRCCSCARGLAQAELNSSYKECRRNHAVSGGLYVFDGCCEFMICNDKPFICGACGCHRNFHRKQSPPATCIPDNNCKNSLLVPPPEPTPPKNQLLSPLPLASHNGLTGETSLFRKVDRINIDSGFETLGSLPVGVENDKKKRRTRFTREQRAKMTLFAHKNLGWRLRRHNEDELLQFCKDVGITRHVFVVWLNNNRRQNKKAIAQKNYACVAAKPIV